MLEFSVALYSNKRRLTRFQTFTLPPVPGTYELEIVFPIKSRRRLSPSHVLVQDRSGWEKPLRIMDPTTISVRRGETITVPFEFTVA